MVGPVEEWGAILPPIEGMHGEMSGLPGKVCRWVQTAPLGGAVVCHRGYGGPRSRSHGEKRCSACMGWLREPRSGSR